MKKIIVAIDSFKGCMSSAEANEAVAERVHQVLPDAEIIQIPVADGGEGWLEAFQYALGGELREIPAHDPLMRPMKAAYLVKGETAVIESAIRWWQPVMVLVSWWLMLSRVAASISS